MKNFFKPTSTKFLVLFFFFALSISRLNYNINIADVAWYGFPSPFCERGTLPLPPGVIMPTSPVCNTFSFSDFGIDLFFVVVIGLIVGLLFEKLFEKFPKIKFVLLTVILIISLFNIIGFIR